jgi:hypothetical protein
MWPTAAIAGVIGGIGIEIYLYLFNHLTPIQHWTFIASVLFGPAQAADHVWLGAVVHYLISIVWASIYVLLAQRFPALWRSPWLWGPVYGVVVAIGMNTLLMIKHVVTGPPSGTMLVQALVVHCIFFALPLALYVGYAGRRAG